MISLNCRLATLLLVVAQCLLMLNLNLGPRTQVLALNKWLGGFVLDRYSSEKLNLKPAFGVINHYLSTELPGDDNFDRNMQQAESLMGKKKPSIAYKKKVSSSRLNTALELFTSLKNVQFVSRRCTHEMTKTLMRNNQAAENAIERMMKTEKLFYFGSVADIRRIDRLVFDAANRRAQVCQPMYKKQFMHYSREYPETDFMRLREYFDSLLEYKLRNNPVPYLNVDDEIHIDDLLQKSPIRVKTFIDKTKVGKLRQDEIDFVLDYLRKVGARNNDRRITKLDSVQGPETKSAANERKSINVALFKDYLVEPCKDYISLFGSVFESALFDHKIKARAPVNKWDEDDYRYHKYLIYFGLCERFVHKEHKLLKQFVDFM